MDPQKKEEVQKEIENTKDIQEELEFYKMMNFNDNKYRFIGYTNRAMAASTGLFFLKIKKLIRRLRKDK